MIALTPGRRRDGDWLMIRIALAVVGLALYFVPSLIAVNRNKRNKNAIFALNLLLGWTFVGWVVALVWSLMRDEPRPGGN